MKRWFVPLAVALFLPAQAHANGRYVALGDSVAAATDSYVVRFGDWLRAHDGVSDVRNVAVGGETSASILGHQLRAALALIRDPTDTRVVTLDIGGNDYLNHTCGTGTWNRPSCPFADNLAYVLSSLRAALDADPGQERLLVLGYYNPASGLGNAQEADIDAGLFGTDARIDPASFGPAWGMTDIVGWEACRFGATLVDAWSAFKAGGQSLILDGIHPSAAGHAVLAGLFEDPASGGPTPPCPPVAPLVTTEPDAGDGMLHGLVEARLAPGRWWFEYGPTTAYGQTTAPQALPAAAGIRGVQTALPQPSGLFHVRVVAQNATGLTTGADQVVLATGASGPTAIAGGGSPIPNVEPPRIAVTVAGTQRLGTYLRMTVVSRDKPCTVWVAGRLRAAGRDYRLVTVSRRLQVGRRATLRPHIGASGRTAARRALAAHRRVTVELFITAGDGTGDNTLLRRTVRLRR